MYPLSPALPACPAFLPILLVKGLDRITGGAGSSLPRVDVAGCEMESSIFSSVAISLSVALSAAILLSSLSFFPSPPRPLVLYIYTPWSLRVPTVPLAIKLALWTNPPLLDLGFVKSQSISSTPSPPVYAF